MTARPLFADNASSRLYQDTEAGSATVRVQAGDGAKFPQPTGDGSNFFTVTLEDRRTGQIEICHCTGRSGDILQVLRGQEGTTAQDFALGATVSNRLTASTMGLLVQSAGLPEAPVDGKIYGRQSNDWSETLGRPAIEASLALKAPLASPVFTGDPQAPTPATADNDTSIATTAHVKANLASYAPLASPTFTGDPKAPTPTTADNDTSIATTAFVKAQGYAPLASPVFTGNPTAPTPTAGDNDTSIATTAFVTGAVATSAAADDARLDALEAAMPLKAPLASPSLSGTPTGPTAAPGTTTTQLATTAFVAAAVVAGGGGEPPIPLGDTTQYWRGDKSWQTLNKAAVGLANVDNTSDVNKPVSTAQAAADALKAPLASPALTGTPTAPTASPGTNTTQLATTAFVTAADSLKAPLASPTFTGKVTTPASAAGSAGIILPHGAAPSAPVNGDLWTTTAGVYARVNGATVGPLSAAGEPPIAAGTTAQYWRGDKSWQTLNKAAVGLDRVDNTNDLEKPVSTATQTQLSAKADLNSPLFTGTPAGPTPTAGDNSIRLATTAFVAAAVAAGGGGGGGGRELLTAARTYYIRTDGNDSNDGLTNSAGGALASLARAWQLITALDGGNFPVTVSFGAGSFPAAFSTAGKQSLLAISSVTIQGADATGSTKVAGLIFDGNIGAPITLSNLEIGSGSTLAVKVNGAGALVIISTGCRFGASQNQLVVSQGGRININGNLAVIVASAINVIWAYDAGIIISPTITCTFTTPLTLSGAYITVEAGGLCFASGNTTGSGTITGSRYAVKTAGRILSTFASISATSFPGSTAGTIDSGNGSIYGATESSPAFIDIPTAPTATAGTNTTQLATTAFVQSAVIASGGGDMLSSMYDSDDDGTVNSADTAAAVPWAGVTGKPATFPPTLPIAQSGVTNLTTDLAAKAPLASPTLTGTPTAPTATPGTNTTQLATTAFVVAADAGKEPTITAGTTAQYWRGDKSWQTLDKAAVGLANVDNTSDANKPVSTAQQTALNLKANLASPTFTGKVTTAASAAGGAGFNAPHGAAPTAPVNGDIWTTTAGLYARINAVTVGPYAIAGEPIITAGTTAQYWRGDKSWQTLDKAAVGLANVDNTSDAAKPVSTAQQTALNLKADLASPTFTGDPKAPTPATADNDTSIATTAYVQSNVALRELSITAGTTAQYWRGDKSWQTLDKAAVGLGNVANTAQVTSVTGTAPVVSSGGTTPAISMAAATTSVPGYLTAADWNTFNGKAPLASPTFTGKVTTAATATGTAGFNLPHGTAPSAPANGDVWTTTAGLYARINAATVGPFGPGGEPPIAAGTTAQYWRGDKSWQTLDKAAVGLGSVDNTSDAAKPVSTATQTALDLKSNIASPTFTGVPAAPTATAGTNTTQLATTAFVTAADNLKANLASPTFTGKVSTAASAAGGAGLVLPHGAAPTSPVNGDVWTTTAGLYARINSVTVGPYGIGGEPAIAAGTTAQYWRGDKSWQTLDKAAVGLGNVANTAQVTTVTGTAPVVSSGGTTPAISMAAATTSVPGYLTAADWNTFNGKAPLASPTFTGTPAAPTASAATNSTQIATTAYVKSQAYLTDAPSDGKRYGRLNAAWSEIVIPGGATALPRNRLVNGAMQISQEWGDTAATALNLYYLADQWAAAKSHSAGTMTLQRVQSVTPNGSKDRVRTTITAADAALAAGEYLDWMQWIEGSRVADFGFGAAGARQVIVRFGFKGPAGTYSLSLRNGAANRSYVTNFTISAGQANTDTEQVFVIPGDTTGTWAVDTAAGMILTVALAVGSTFVTAPGSWVAGSFFGGTGISNGMGTAGAVFELFDAGLYLDPGGSGAPPPWEMPDPADELRVCMRYFQKVFAAYFGTVTTGFGYNSLGPVVVPMRVTPTFTGTNAYNGSFPATLGTIGLSASNVITEFRIANASAANGSFAAHWNCNARM